MQINGGRATKRDHDIGDVRMWGIWCRIYYYYDLRHPLSRNVREEAMNIQKYVLAKAGPHQLPKGHSTRRQEDGC